MPNWSASMAQHFEYYVVDPNTWNDVKMLSNVTSCSISRDVSSETLGSASIEVVDPISECYMRVYLVTTQNGVVERHPLGTYLLQTPSVKYNGSYSSTTMDGYTPLIELKESRPPIGYSIFKDENIIANANIIVRENTRAPLVEGRLSKTLYNDFVANNDDSWLIFCKDLLANAKYEFRLDEYGRIMFSPIQELNDLNPIWTYNNDNSSILYPDVTTSRDLYGIPNVVEVLYSDNGVYYYSRVVNDDPNSPVSIVNRGREIVKRVENPSGIGIPSQAMISEYAVTLMESLSSLEYSVSYSHGYCPVEPGDCVMLNYPEAGLINVKARVTSQNLTCSAGMSVSETAVFTKKLWGGSL